MFLFDILPLEINSIILIYITDVDIIHNLYKSNITSIQKLMDTEIFWIGKIKIDFPEINTIYLNSYFSNSSIVSKILFYSNIFKSYDKFMNLYKRELFYDISKYITNFNILCPDHALSKIYDFPRFC